MATEGESLSAETESARAKRRAVSSLLCVSQRMTYLMSEPTANPGKLNAELAGMSAWISAFTCQLAGLPIELTPAPEGEFMLASVELTRRSETLVDARAELASEGLRGVCEDAASRRAAIALSLVALAAQVLGGAEQPLREVDEPGWRRCEAERRLLLGLETAYQNYFNEGLDPNTYVPEISAHGMPEDG